MKSKYITVLRVFAVLSMIGGIIGAFVLATTLGKEYTITGSYYTRVIETRNWGKTIGFFIAGIFSGYISYVIFASIAEVLDFQERITMDLHNLNQMICMQDKSHINREPNSDEWKCKCGKINKKYIMTCTCGREFIL